MDPSPSPSSDDTVSCIPVEIVSEEEMALIEAALALASTYASSRHLLSSSRLAAPFSTLASPLLAASSAAVPSPDFEDTVWKPGPPKSLLLKFRPRRGLMVTDVTATEWCEKQMEFVLLRGKPTRTEAMKAGSDRHAELEDEVVERIEIHVKSVEESWAVKLMNFIAGANRLIFDGLTRELPVMGVIEGTWMSGVIDEIQMPLDEATQNPFLVDTKTRYRATLPSEAQKRNARLQLMCYKYMWDALVTNNFPTEHFFSHFGLDPKFVLSEEVREYVALLGFDAKTFEGVVTCFKNTCCLLPASNEQLLLRYELQSDNSLLEEYKFSYDAVWFKDQIQDCLKFWMGEREARYVTEAEKWKCRFCAFSNVCPMPTASDSRPE